MLMLCSSHQGRAATTASPKVSVVIPTYNQGNFLIEAIASVERVASKHASGMVELQIVDDGTDDTRSLDILDKLRELGYRVHRQENKGLSTARNTGLSLTQAPFILPLDDDNLLLDGYISYGIKILESDPEIAGVYGDRHDFGLIEQTFRPGPIDEERLWRMNYIDACALVRRSWIEKCRGYDEELTALEDWDLWLSILKMGGKLFYLSKPCFAYRHRPGSMIRRFFNSAEDQRRIIERLNQKY